MWENNTYNPFGGSTTGILPTAKEESQYESEMCDICCKSYNYKNIRRVPFVNKAGILFVLRCCPYCNPETLTRYL